MQERLCRKCYVPLFQITPALYSGCNLECYTCIHIHVRADHPEIISNGLLLTLVQNFRAKPGDNLFLNAYTTGAIPAPSCFEKHIDAHSASIPTRSNETS